MKIVKILFLPFICISILNGGRIVVQSINEGNVSGCFTAQLTKKNSEGKYVLPFCEKLENGSYAIVPHFNEIAIFPGKFESFNKPMWPMPLVTFLKKETVQEVMSNYPNEEYYQSNPTVGVSNDTSWTILPLSHKYFIQIDEDETYDFNFYFSRGENNKIFLGFEATASNGLKKVKSYMLPEGLMEDMYIALDLQFTNDDVFLTNLEYKNISDYMNKEEHALEKEDDIDKMCIPFDPYPKGDHTKKRYAGGDY